MRIPIIPQSVQVVVEGGPALLRIVELNGDVTDYQLNKSQLRLLACQAVALALKGSQFRDDKLEGQS